MTWWHYQFPDGSDVVSTDPPGSQSTMSYPKGTTVRALEYPVWISDTADTPDTPDIPDVNVPMRITEQPKNASSAWRRLFLRRRGR